MTAYLRVEFETQNIDNIEGCAEDLNRALKDSFAGIGLDDLDGLNNLVVSLEQPKELTVVETAVVLGLIGIAKSLVELYKFIKQKELEEKKIELEKAKLEFEKLSETDRHRLREAFVRDDLPQILFQANITNVTNTVTSVVVQE